MLGSVQCVFIGSDCLRKILIILGSAVGALLIVLGVLVWLLTPPTIKVPSQQDHIISYVTIWNPGEAPIENQSIVIADGLITEIRDTQADDPEPLCPGCYVMPGLIDAHIHTPPQLAIGNQRLYSLLYLYYGVTTIRDLGELDGSVPKLVDKIAKGKIPGPRMYRCGPALDGTPASFQGAVNLETAEDGRAKVAALAAEGVDCIKVYDKLPAAAFEGVEATAREYGLPLVGHTPHSVKLSEITDFENQHYTGVPYLENDPPEGFAYLSQDLIDMSEEEIDALLALMVQNNISILPTNANQLARLTVSDRDRFPATEGLMHLPLFWQQAWPNIVSHAETPEEIETELRAGPPARAFNRRARAAGIDVLVGTDVVMPYVIPGEALHLQLEMLSQAFGSDEAALEAATRVNARHIDEGMIGRIQTGAYADLLFFEDDPRRGLASMPDWTLLIANGRLYDRASLDEAVKRYDRHFNGKIYSTVMNFVYSLL